MTDPRCGTDAGATAHRRAGEPPCQPCREAAGQATAERRRARRLTTAAKLRPVPPPAGDWTDQAACRAVEDWELFFPDTRDITGINRAKAWCQVCPVMADCLNYALDNARYGVWGGMDEDERRTERRRRQRRESMAATRAAARQAEQDAEPTEPAPPPKREPRGRLGKPGFGKARCPLCEYLIELRVDGRLQSHPYKRTKGRCDGSERLPKQEQEAG